ncbi:hypothetical protein B7P43_G04453 [Cryptotermes secundus]|uniref:Uncharacterized protein n=1 Tax=Cryptotermes secundus TaxID=105785 RepID=A0A2J7QC64_9NEOP|nr:hypothetical protein B7P43_G04453 [Cryptotermes secundus]
MEKGNWNPCVVRPVLLPSSRQEHCNSPDGTFPIALIHQCCPLLFWQAIWLEISDQQGLKSTGRIHTVSQQFSNYRWMRQPDSTSKVSNFPCRLRPGYDIVKILQAEFSPATLLPHHQVTLNNLVL